jgi:site-specific recombinase XerD
MSTSPKGSSLLLDRVRAACQRKGYSYRTEQTYTRWIVRYVKYHDTTHPRHLEKSDVRAYLSYLATERTVAASTQNQALSVLAFHKNPSKRRASHFGASSNSVV